MKQGCMVSMAITHVSLLFAGRLVIHAVFTTEMTHFGKAKNQSTHQNVFQIYQKIRVDSCE